MTKNVTRLPSKGIAINLDTVEKDEKDVFEPFVAVFEGREMTFIDPTEMDYRDLAAIVDPVDFARYAISPDDRQYLASKTVPGWKFGKLFEAYNEHFGLERRVQEARDQISRAERS